MKSNVLLMRFVVATLLTLMQGQTNLAQQFGSVIGSFDPRWQQAGRMPPFLDSPGQGFDFGPLSALRIQSPQGRMQRPSPLNSLTFGSSVSARDAFLQQQRQQGSSLPSEMMTPSDLASWRGSSQIIRARAGVSPQVATSTNNNSPTVTRGLDAARQSARTRELRPRVEEGSRTSAERLLLTRVHSTVRRQNAFTGLPGTHLIPETGAFVQNRDRSLPLDSKRRQSISDAALGLQLPAESASPRSPKGASELELRLLSREAQEELLRQQQLQLQHQHQLQSQRQQEEQLPRSHPNLQGATDAGQKRANPRKLPLKLKSEFPPRYLEVSLRVNLIKSMETKQADAVTNMIKSSSSNSDSATPPVRVITSHGPNATSDLKGISSPNGGDFHTAGTGLLHVQQMVGSAQLDSTSQTKGLTSGSKISETVESQATLTSVQASPRAEVQASNVMESKVAAASSITNPPSSAGGGSSEPVFQNFETLTMTANVTSETNSKILGNTSGVVESVNISLTSPKSTGMLELLSAARGLLDGTSEAGLLALSSAPLPHSPSTNLTSPSNMTSSPETPGASNSSMSTALEIVSLLDPDASHSIPATLGAEVTQPGAGFLQPRSDGTHNRDFVHLIQKLSQQLDMLLGDRALTKPHLVGLTSPPVETGPSLRSEELIGDNMTSSFGLRSGDAGVQIYGDSLSSSTNVNASSVAFPELGSGGLGPRLLGSFMGHDDLPTNKVQPSLPSLVNGFGDTNLQPLSFLNSTNTSTNTATLHTDGELLSAKHNISNKEKISNVTTQPSKLGIGLLGETDVFSITKSSGNDSVTTQPMLTSFANSVPHFTKDLNSAIDFSGHEYLATPPLSKIEADTVVRSASAATSSALLPSFPPTLMSQKRGTTDASQTSYAAQRLANVLTILLEKNPEILHLIRGLDTNNSSSSPVSAHNIPFTSYPTLSKIISNGTREDSLLSNAYVSSVLTRNSEERNVSVDGVSNTSHVKPVQAPWTDPGVSFSTLYPFASVNLEHAQNNPVTQNSDRSNGSSRGEAIRDQSFLSSTQSFQTTQNVAALDRMLPNDMRLPSLAEPSEVATTGETSPNQTGPHVLNASNVLNDPVFLHLLKMYFESKRFGKINTINETVMNRTAGETSGIPKIVHTTTTTPQSVLSRNEPSSIFEEFLNQGKSMVDNLKSLFTNRSGSVISNPPTHNYTPPSFSSPSWSTNHANTLTNHPWHSGHASTNANASYRSPEIKPTDNPNRATVQVFSYPLTQKPFSFTQPPTVTKAQYAAIEELYHTLSYLKTRDPDVLSRLRTVLQMFAPQVKMDPKTLTHLSKEQLLAAGIPVSSALETMAVSTALHLLAQVYKLSVSQVLDVVSGKRPSQIAQLASEVSATHGANPPQTNAQSAQSGLLGSVPSGFLGNSGNNSNSSNSFTISPFVDAAGGNGTMMPTTTASVTAAMVSEPTEPTEEPEPGDPGFIDFYFKPGSNITQKHVTMLREMMGV